AHAYMAAYAASKGGVHAFTHSLAREYAARGLRAVAVAPGGIRTPLLEGTLERLPADVDLQLFDRILPITRDGFAPPETVAGVIAMLASDDGVFATGTVGYVDGGTSA